MDAAFCKNSSEIEFLFTKLNLKNFKKLKLQNHMDCRKGCRNSSFKLLNLYLTNNPGFNDREFFKEEKSLKQYNNWKLLNKINYRVAERIETGGSSSGCKENFFNVFNVRKLTFDEGSLY